MTAPPEGRPVLTCDEDLLCAPEVWGLSGEDAARIVRQDGEIAGAFRALAGIGKAVSIFGSARTRPDEGAYWAWARYTCSARQTASGPDDGASGTSRASGAAKVP